MRGVSQNRSNGVSFVGNTVPKSAQGIQGIVEEQVFFDVIVCYSKQFFDAGKDRLLGYCEALGDYGLIGFEECGLIEDMPGGSILPDRSFHGC
jgi:hypothetical protein